MTAIEATKETWTEAEIYRIGGEIALMSPEPEAAKAETYFERALAVASRRKDRKIRGLGARCRCIRETVVRPFAPRNTELFPTRSCIEPSQARRG
jgi:hypothetical protein